MFGSKKTYRIEPLACEHFGHFALDETGKIVRLNPVMPKILQISNDGVVGKELYELFPSELKKEIASAVDRAIAGHEVRLNIQFNPQNTGVDKINLFLQPLDTETRHIEGIVEEANNSRNTFHALQESEEKFRSIVERANDGICIVQDFIIHYANQQLANIIGYSTEEIIGKEFMPLIAPEERAKVKNRYIKRMSGESVPPIYETRLLSEDGRIIDVEFNAGISLYRGRPADFVLVRDITYRKKTEKALRNTQRELSTLLSNLPGMAYSCRNDHDWTMEFVSEGCLSLTGYTTDELIGNKALSYNELIHPDDREYVWDTIQIALDNRQPFTLEYRIISADGREKWVWEQGRGSATEGKEFRLEGFITDITERKRIEHSLKESEERYRNLFNNSALGIFRTTPDGRVLMANPTLLKMLGYTSFDELAKANLEEKDFFGPDSPRSAFKKQIESMGKVNGLESVWISREGKKVFVRENAKAVLDDDGKLMYYEGTVEDITSSKVAEERRRESEDKYRGLFEQATDAVFIESVEGKILDVNTHVVDILGYSPNELIGEHISKIVPEEEARKLKIHFEDLEKGTGFRVESYNIHKDGHLIPIEANIMPIYVSGERLIFAFVRDISEKRRLEEQLQLSQKMEALGKLAGGIAHDFNNLITGFYGYIDLLRFNMLADDPNYPTLEDLENVASKAASLTKQLLAFSRKQVLCPELIDINEIIGDMVTMLQRIIGDDIDFRFEPEDDLPPIKVDRSQLEQVLMNLVINSADAMPDGGRLTVETMLVDFDKDYVHQHSDASFGKHVLLAISDTGCGITPEDLPKVFEPFFTTKGAGVGTGLGLPTVYGIVKQSGGYIYVYSEINEGTTFKVYFPAIIPKCEVDEEPLKEIPMTGDETILVVDDDDDVRKAIIQALSYNGYSVIEASNGREALERIENLKGPLHLVITDIVMPKLGGRDLVEIIRDIYPNVKIIYMSGYTDKTIMEPEIESAPGEFFAKPFSAESLAKKVREILDR